MIFNATWVSCFMVLWYHSIPLSPNYISFQLHQSPFKIGLFYFLQSTFYLLFSLPAGRLTDKLVSCKCSTTLGMHTHTHTHQYCHIQKTICGGRGKSPFQNGWFHKSAWKAEGPIHHSEREAPNPERGSICPTPEGVYTPIATSDVNSHISHTGQPQLPPLVYSERTLLGRCNWLD